VRFLLASTFSSPVSSLPEAADANLDPPYFNTTLVFSCYHFTSQTHLLFPPKGCGKFLYCIYIQERIRDRQISQVYLRKPCISSNSLPQGHSENCFFSFYIPRPDFSTRLGIKQHINWPKNITLHSSTELIILLQKLPAQRPQSRNRIYPLFLKKTDPT